MKYLYFVLFCFFIVSCDYIGVYMFEVKNDTSNQIKLHFQYEQYGSGNENYGDIVSISPGEEKTIRIVDAPLNSPAHDCLKEHGMAYFDELIFDTYLDGIKLEKQLWQPENWIYSSSSRWEATYSMEITDEMIELNNE